jgi:hypothetical protein
MATKSIKEWFDYIETERQTMTELSALQPAIDNSNTLLSDLSKSKVADHRIWIWISAVLAWTLDALFETHKQEVEQIIIESRFGTLPWYKEMTLRFQHGDSLIWINNQFSYSQLVESMKIVKYASASALLETVLIKAAKQVNNEPVPLTPVELDSLKAYWSKMQPPGQNVQIVSSDADKLGIDMTIYYDAQKLTSSGEGILSGLKPVEIAIQQYLNGIEFSGIFDVNELIDMVQTADGVKRPYINLIEYKPQGSAVWIPITRFAEPSAGYFAIDTVTINYIANV